jgi:hypothetical protein
LFESFHSKKVKGKRLIFVALLHSENSNPSWHCFLALCLKEVFHLFLQASGFHDRSSLKRKKERNKQRRLLNLEIPHRSHTQKILNENGK